MNDDAHFDLNEYIKNVLEISCRMHNHGTVCVTFHCTAS